MSSVILLLTASNWMETLKSARHFYSGDFDWSQYFGRALYDFAQNWLLRFLRSAFSLLLILFDLRILPLQAQVLRFLNVSRHQPRLQKGSLKNLGKNIFVDQQQLGGKENNCNHTKNPLYYSVFKCAEIATKMHRSIWFS